MIAQLRFHYLDVQSGYEEASRINGAKKTNGIA